MAMTLEQIDQVIAQLILETEAHGGDDPTHDWWVVEGLEPDLPAMIANDLADFCGANASSVAMGIMVGWRLRARAVELGTVPA